MTVRNEILVGVDGCPSSDAAVVWAAGEAASRGAGLILVHALDMNAFGLSMTTAPLRHTLREIAQPTIDHALELAAKHQPSVPARGRVLIGSPTRTLLFLSGKVRLTVVGRTGRGALARLWLGTVTQRVLAHASSPAVAVGGSDAATAGTVSRIVVGIDESPTDASVLEFAFNEAQRRCVPLEALHVIRRPGSPSSELVDDPHPEHLDAEERQAKALNEWAATYPGVAVTSIVRAGHVGEVFADVCRPTDLLVLGHHRHAPYSPYQLGRAASAALHDTTCSVAVIHQPAANSAE
jgi:nucleotide-binding universal stress UspA family protein